MMMDKLTNVALGPLTEMALENPPELQDKIPCLLYVSTSHLETQQTFIDDLSRELIGVLVDETTYRTRNGWTVLFRHSMDREVIDTFRTAIKERNDYQIVENWSEYALKRTEDIPRLLACVEQLHKQQTRH